MTPEHVDQLSLEQLEVLFILYVASKVVDHGMTFDDICLCKEMLERLGQRYVRESRHS